MSIHQSYAHMLANSTAVTSRDDPRPLSRSQRLLVRLGFEIELRPARLLAVAIASVTLVCVVLSWVGYVVLSPAIGAEWGSRITGAVLGLTLGVPTLLMAMQRAR